MKKLAKILLLILGSITLCFAALGWQIYAFGAHTTDASADAAIVLGAAVWGKELSPVFRERVNHAVELYKNGKVRKIIFTGGQGNADELTESAAARKYSIENGVPENDILIEEKSHSTYENIFYAKQAADAAQLKTFLIVSDPLHMKRSMLMAHDLNLDAFPSPTPTTMYQSAKSRFFLLTHETYYYSTYLLSRVLAGKPHTNE